MTEQNPTPLPWRLYDDGTDVFVFDSADGCILRRMKDPAGIEERNAAFIVEAVNNYPALQARLEEVERLNGQLLAAAQRTLRMLEGQGTGRLMKTPGAADLLTAMEASGSPYVTLAEELEADRQALLARIEG